MRPAPVAFSDVAAIVKANLSGWYLLLALLLFSLFMSGCNTAEIEGNILPVADCVQQVTAVVNS